MAIYNAEIDGGQGGETTFEVDTIEEAMVQAIAWAEQGDWPPEGCTISLRVWSDEDDEELKERVEIPSAESKKDATLESEGEVVAEYEEDWSTRQIVLMGDEAYYAHPNGGSRGSYNREDGVGVWRERPVEPTRRISRAEARTLMLDWGYSPVQVAKVTRRIDQ